ncbi:hypothetical protein C8A01DRAFT_15382 [Parachaetomium inaequale]|uniref:F-box domain-containing protein n=1 Tax=Parachaetomium inaequale TaxID=2588326 RepID=A0AAN6PH05_9PEZI|nr:hypothetical protein C8A01DRAFT_15382 [Parachaetomium inaequale]
MWGPGGVSCIIRFICHIPSGMMGARSLTNYNYSMGLGDIYDVIPHGKTFIQGMGVVGYAGVFTLAWNFVMFGASPFCRGSLLGLIGVVDLVLTIILTAGVAMQGQFLPGSYEACNGASDWNNGTDGRNFFVVANATDSFGIYGPDSICHNMMENWVFAIVVIMFYMISGIINISLGFLGEPGTIAEPYSFGQYDIDHFSWLFKPVRLLFKPVHMLYRFLRGSSYISFRYMSKYLARNKEANRPTAKQSQEGGNPYEKSASEPQSLRLPMELVIMITKDLHWTDLANLGRTSRYLRTLFFGADNPAQVARDLRHFACKDGGPLINCAVCSIQTCVGCRTNVSVPHSEAFRHLTGCQAACSKCFFKNHCYGQQRPAQPGYGWNDRTSSDDSSSAQFRPSWGGRLISSSSGYRLAGSSQNQTYDEVCHTCAQLSRREMEEVRDAHNLREIQRQARTPTACYSCRRMLAADGVRWWVDPQTGRECQWHGHPGWARAGAS